MAEPRVETSVEQRRGDALDPPRMGTIEFAEGQRVQIVEVDNRALGLERRRDHAQPAEHAVGPETLAQLVEVPHAVQQRQNRRLRTDRLGERRHRALEVVSFAAQQHEVERLRELFPRDSRRRGAAKVAAATANGQPVLREFRSPARTNQKRDVAARLQQTSAEIAPDRARPDHKNSHVTRTLSE